VCVCVCVCVCGREREREREGVGARERGGGRETARVAPTASRASRMPPAFENLCCGVWGLKFGVSGVSVCGFRVSGFDCGLEVWSV
jgi:hypothetical protein